MSSMTLAQQIITIGMCILGTMATRYLPFFIFKENKKTPEYIQYLGKFLPSAVFGMLVIYCLKNVEVLRNSWNSGRNLHSCHSSTSSMEEKYVSIHCRWNYLLYVDIIFSIIISIAKRSETTCAYTLAVAVLTSCDQQPFLIS